MDGRLAGPLQLIFTIQDKERVDDAGKNLYYARAVVDLFKPLHGGRPQEPHGMVEV